MKMNTVKLASITVICVAIFGGAYMLNVSDSSEAAATITFDPNGGAVYDGNNHVIGPYSSAIDSPVYIPGSNFQVCTGTNQTYRYILEGYGFLGWSDTPQDPDAEDYNPVIDYPEGGLIPTSATDKTVYAVWDKNSYAVNLTYTDTYARTIYIPYGRELQDLSSYMNYVPEEMAGYRVVGWASKPMPGTKDANGAYLMPDLDFNNGDKRYSQIARLNMGAGDMTIYAIWGKVYTLSGTTTTTIANGTGDEGCYYFTSNGNKLTGGGLVINGGNPYVFVDAVNLEFSYITETATTKTNVLKTSNSPFILNNGANVELTVMSDCTFRGGTGGTNNTIGYAGINVQRANNQSSTLTISEYSEGTLTAVGGDGYEPRNNSAYPGAGIGANGSQNCGIIIINGGKVNAVGGDCIEEYGSTAGQRKTSGPGIGGTNARIQINSGIVTATSGNVHAQRGDNCYKTYTVNGSTEVRPIYSSNNSYIQIDQVHAEVRENQSGQSHIYSTGTRTIYITFTGAQIGNVLGLTVNGTSLDLGGMTLISGTSIEVREDVFPANTSEKFEVILSTGHNNYFSNYYKGSNENKASLHVTWSDYNQRYDVTIDESNDTPRGLVDVYFNEESIRGTETFATLEPNQELTVSGTNNATQVLKTFILTVAEGYEFTGIKYSTDGETWTNRVTRNGDSFDGLNTQGNLKERIDIGPNDISITLRMTVNTSGTARNHLSFTIEPVSYNITYTVKNNEDDSFNFQYKMISTGDQNPEDIQWGNSAPYNSATQRAYYKSGKTLVFHTEYGSSNPFNLLLVTINDENVTSNLTNQGDGTFTLELTDINCDLNIEVHYRPTMLVKAYYPVLDNQALTNIGTNAKVTLVDANGDPIPFIAGPAGVTVPRNGSNIRLPLQGEGQDSTGKYVYAYVNRNDTVHFVINDYQILKDNSTHTDIKDIRITIGETSYIMPSGLYVNEIYDVSNVYDNASILVTLSRVQLMVTCISYNGTDQASSTIVMSTGIETFDGAYITLPTAESLAGMDGTYITGSGDTKMYVKTGYKLLKWKAESGYELDPGSKFNVYTHETFTAQWDTEPEVYSITYDLKGYIEEFNTKSGQYELKPNLSPGTNGVGNPASYTINSSTISFNPGTMNGYDCLWSLDGAEHSDSITIVPGTGENQYHRDVTLTAYWISKNVTIVYHNNLPTGSTEQINLPGDYEGGEYVTHTTVGRPYGSLPYYRNFEYNDKNYSFGGWATNSQGTERITENTMISMPNNPQNIIDLYIIWIEGSTYVISLEYDRNQGSATVSALSGNANDNITLTVNPGNGYESYKVSVNGVEKGDFHQGDTSATITLTGTNYLFRIRVEFTPLEYDIKVLRPYSMDAETVTTGGITYYVMETESGTKYYMRLIGNEPKYYDPSTLVDDDPSTLVDVTASVTVDTYYVSYAVNSYTVVSDPIYLTKPQSNAYPNHTFYGWTGTDIVDVERNVVEIPKGSYGDRRYIEIWTPNAYSITYHLFGGTHSNPTRCNVGEVMILTDAVKAGYGFDGWYRNYDENTGEYSDLLTNNTLPDTITSDIDLYAKYSEATEVDFPFDSYDERDDENKKLIVYADDKAYNGDAQHVIEVVTVNTPQGQRPAYSFTGSYEGIYADEMVFTVTLSDKCVWGNIGGSHIDPYLRDYDIEVHWSITPRTLYIVTPTYYKVYDGTEITILANDFKTIGLTYFDNGVNTRFSISSEVQQFTNAGEYPLIVTVDNQAYAYNSYTIVFIQGSCVIFKEDCATFTVPIKETSPPPAGSQMSAQAVAHMLTYSQTVPGPNRRLIG